MKELIIKNHTYMIHICIIHLIIHLINKKRPLSAAELFFLLKKRCMCKMLKIKNIYVYVHIYIHIYRSELQKIYFRRECRKSSIINTLLF